MNRPFADLYVGIFMVSEIKISLEMSMVPSCTVHVMHICLGDLQFMLNGHLSFHDQF